MRFHPNQTKHQQAMRMSKFSIELLLGVSVKISHQQIGSISTLLFECLVFLFRSPNIQIAFFFFRQWLLHLVLSCYVSLNSGLPVIGFVWDSFVDSDAFWWSQAQWLDNEYEGYRLVTATHLSAPKEEKHVNTDWYIIDTIKPQLHSTHESKMTYELSF